MKKQKTQSARELKEETVKSLAEKIARAKTLIFADYHGLNALQINDLRRKIKAAGGELVVTKNTLLDRALEIENFLSVRKRDQLKIENYLVGPTASIFAYEDEIAPLKAAADSAKSQGSPQFKFGFFGRDFLDLAACQTLAIIPTRPELNAKVVGTIASPIWGLVNVLSANIRNLVSILDQAARR